ncbi:hypothetical protein WBG78_04245 [Chryseolinea sp. T2]|uniref:hypothetical protein n=1 Tax=Chryseolinea sp. T2 TaxID=3129255 RepID=UPI0030773258
MAYSENNNLTNSVKGKLGDSVVFKQYNGKTIYCKTPQSPRSESSDQKMNRDQFREASAWAVKTLLNPVDKESFRLEAKRLKLKDPYTAALQFKLREIKAHITAGFEWAPILTLKQATEAATRKSKRLAERARALNASPAPGVQSVSPTGGIDSIEATELRKSVDEMNRSLQENLLAMQKSIQESLLEMNKAVLAISELVKSSLEAQRQPLQREQLKQSIHTSLRPAIASMESVRRSSESMPAAVSNSMLSPGTALLNDTLLHVNASETNLLNSEINIQKQKSNTYDTTCDRPG